MAVFVDRTIIPRARDAVFQFLIQVRNLERITAGELGLSFVSAPERLVRGAVIEFRIQGLGMVQRAVHEVVEFDPPVRFVERQVQGPMRFWVHEHLFHEEEGRTVVEDRIEFQPPGGMLGLLATESRILESLEEGFFSRNRTLLRLIEAEVAVDR
jgi:ligand-binding SRPBCC domain-containing protein